jgi:glycosyltransferase involved in cell wall biosynthesis
LAILISSIYIGEGLMGKVYFNFLYAPNGGGYQNSISFVKSLIGLKHDFSNVVFLVFKGSSIELICKGNSISYFSISNSVFSKYYFELKMWRRIGRDDLVFSIFGPPMLGQGSKCINIGGMAISNVLHPEIDFWSYLSFWPKFLKKIKDGYRLYRYMRLDYWIFETELLKEKAVIEFAIPEVRCEVIKMTPSILVKKENIDINDKLVKNISQLLGTKFLFLASSHPNKRLHVLPKLALFLKSKKIKAKFIITVEPNTYYSDVLKDIKSLKVNEYFVNLGEVSPERVATLISTVDCVCTFSLLESFSNNFVEAWAMDKPLLVTNSLWARKSCKNAAIYVDVDNESKLNQQILNVIKGPEENNRVIIEGREMLSIHPSTEEKTIAYINAIEKVKLLGKIAPKERPKMWR